MIGQRPSGIRTVGIPPYESAIPRRTRVLKGVLNRAVPEAPVELALTASELHVLDHLLTGPPTTRNTLSYYLNKIARLGGYLARGSDPPPGNIVMWRGLSRLRDIELGATIPTRCG
jgi:hypothetical protein